MNQTLSRYLDDVRKIPRMGVRIRSILLQDILRSERERQNDGLLTNDSINLALMRRLQVKYIATCDRDFDRVDGVTLWRPKDLIIP
ncbi:MAG: type II toxin-antitoxin system VapC family toxin [Candidatus Latescibacteria bacterium]|nr:type II toxin-antitoxin system VapC family toxin [Candidatus Latescibacterota bacterium]